MGQSGSGDTRTLAQLADSQALGAGAHEGAQHGEALFGAKCRKGGGREGKVEVGNRLLFHISRIIEMKVCCKPYF